MYAFVFGVSNTKYHVLCTSITDKIRELAFVYGRRSNIAELFVLMKEINSKENAKNYISVFFYVYGRLLQILKWSS